MHANCGVGQTLQSSGEGEGGEARMCGWSKFPWQRFSGTGTAAEPQSCSKKNENILSQAQPASEDVEGSKHQLDTLIQF